VILLYFLFDLGAVQGTGSERREGRPATRSKEQLSRLGDEELAMMHCHSPAREAQTIGREWTERAVLNGGRWRFRGKPSASSELGEGQLARCEFLQGIEGSPSSMMLSETPFYDPSPSSSASRLAGSLKPSLALGARRRQGLEGFTAMYALPRFGCGSFRNRAVSDQ